MSKQILQPFQYGSFPATLTHFANLSLSVAAAYIPVPPVINNHIPAASNANVSKTLSTKPKKMTKQIPEIYKS